MTSNYGSLVKEASVLLDKFSADRQCLDDFIEDVSKNLQVVICYLATFALDDLGLQRFSTIVKSLDIKKMHMVPNSTYKTPKELKNMEKIKQQNQKKTERVMAQIKEDLDSKLKFNSFHSSGSSSINKTNSWPIKLNSAAILRQGALYDRQVEEELQRVERLMEGAREPSSFLQWQKEMREKDLQEELAMIERRRLEGRISYEEAAIARTRLMERNQRTAQLKKEETAQLMRRYAEKRLQEEKEMRDLVQQVAEGHKNSKAAKEKLLKFKQSIVKEVSEQSRELLRQALEEAQAELSRRFEIIYEIRAIESLPHIRIRNFDDTETAGHELLGEMSLAELKERLALLREAQQTEQQEKREHILEEKQYKKQLLLEQLDTIDLHRRVLAQAAAIRKEERRARMSFQQAVTQDETVLALQRKLEEKQQERQRLKQIKSKKAKSCEQTAAHTLNHMMCILSYDTDERTDPTARDRARERASLTSSVKNKDKSTTCHGSDLQILIIQCPSPPGMVLSQTTLTPAVMSTTLIENATVLTPTPVILSSTTPGCFAFNTSTCEPCAPGSQYDNISLEVHYVNPAQLDPSTISLVETVAQVVHQCQTCPGGTESLQTAAKDCTPCRPGMHKPPHHTMCQICGSGYYQIHWGQESCDICPENHYCPSPDVNPIQCPSDAFCPEGSLAPGYCMETFFRKAGDTCELAPVTIALLVIGGGGLLRPLSVSLCAKTPQLCQLSSLIQPTPLHSTAAAAVRAPLRAAVCQAPRYNILQRVSALIPSLTQQPSRSLTYYSVKKGKRKTVKSVTDRFMRLHCGLWIRRKAGYKKKLWKKSPPRRKRLREHVFCNKTQSKLLDKMTTSFWKRRNWYLDDPYLKYHDRVNLKL
ncbi:Cilia-and flagella-associated protein 99 [Nibea albiflora]|uniref:Cilia-and flagella-associated protein 99 n=1 Tax=Nibea albiflora TaxID=240163 RepID=A0ACB7FHP8_NIBAL|nr:Cilia-and flagella-associated protein 99 [Nibea albiflora]